MDQCISAAERAFTRASWYAAHQRCGNPGVIGYQRYGGRGIAVCERWGDFECFLADMGVRPPGMTLDRIDGSRGYEPGNCRWATMRTQQRNRSSNRLVTVDGVTRPVIEWVELSGVKFTTFVARLDRGWSPEEAVGRPVGGAVLKPRAKKPGPVLTVAGVTRSLEEWAADAGLTARLVASRLRKGWQVDEALAKPAHRGVRRTSLG